MGKRCFTTWCWNQDKTTNECWEYWDVEKCADREVHKNGLLN